RQNGACAVGICCAKVGEAEVMAAAGIRNMLITTEVVGPEKIGRLMGVLEQAAETMEVVDNPDNIRELAQAMAGRVRRPWRAHGQAGELTQFARPPGICRALRPCAGLCQPAQDVAPLDEQAHEDARSLREKRTARGDRERDRKSVVEG